MRFPHSRFASYTTRSSLFLRRVSPRETPTRVSLGGACGRECPSQHDGSDGQARLAQCAAVSGRARRACTLVGELHGEGEARSLAVVSETALYDRRRHGCRPSRARWAVPVGWARLNLASAALVVTLSHQFLISGSRVAAPVAAAASPLGGGGAKKCFSWRCLVQVELSRVELAAAPQAVEPPPSWASLRPCARHTLAMSAARVTSGQACATLRVAAAQQRPAQPGPAQPLASLASRTSRASSSGLVLPQGAAAGRGALSVASAATFPRGNDIYVPPSAIVQPMINMQGEVRRAQNAVVSIFRAEEG